NVGPTGRGEFEPQAQLTLAEIGTWMRRHHRSIVGATMAEEPAPVDCRFTRRGDRLYLHIFTWPLRHVHLEGFSGRIDYAQFLPDGSELTFRDANPDVIPQNTDMAEQAGAAILELPFRRPDVTVPVVELFLKDG